MGFHVCLGEGRDNGKRMETTIYWGYIGDYIGIVENNMETTIYWGYIGDYIF